MTEARRVYRVTGNTAEEINRILSLLADRLDELEGFRGQGNFLKPPTSQADATNTAELARYGQVITISQSYATSAVASIIVTLRANTLKIYAQDDGTTVLHGMGDVP